MEDFEVNNEYDITHLIKKLEAYIDKKAELPEDNTCWIHGEGCEPILVENSLISSIIENRKQIRHLDTEIKMIQKDILSKNKEEQIQLDLDVEVVKYEMHLIEVIGAFVLTSTEHARGTRFFCKDFVQFYWDTFKSLMKNLRKILGRHVHVNMAVILDCLQEEYDRAMAIAEGDIQKVDNLIALAPSEEQKIRKQVHLAVANDTRTDEEKADLYYKIQDACLNLKDYVCDQLFISTKEVSSLLKKLVNDDKSLKKQMFSLMKEIIRNEIESNLETIPKEYGGNCIYEQGLDRDVKALFRIKSAEIDKLKFFLSLNSIHKINMNTFIDGVMGTINKILMTNASLSVTRDDYSKIMYGLQSSPDFLIIRGCIKQIDNVIKKHTGISVANMYDHIHHIKKDAPAIQLIKKEDYNL